MLRNNVSPSSSMISRMTPRACCVRMRRVAYRPSVALPLERRYFGASGNGGTIKQHGGVTCQSASSSDLLEVIKNSPADKKAIQAAAEQLPMTPGALDTLQCDWEVIWSSMSTGKSGPMPASLKAFSFSALPDIKISICDSQNRITSDKYDLLQIFTLPASTVKAAMILCGTWNACETANRLEVHFNAVKVVLPPGGAPEALQALKDAGIEVGVEVPIPAPPTYIDITYIDQVLRVHKGASGMVYVLKRMEPARSIPYYS